MTSLRTRQINPVVHQAHAGFVLPRHKTISTIAVHRPFILNLHTVSLIKAVFDIGENTPERLQRLTLGGDNQITVNAPLQKQQCFIKLDLRAVRSAVHFFQPAAEGNRTAFNHMYFRVIVRIAVQICRIQKIQHFPDFIFRHVIKPQQGAVQMHITRNRHNGIYHKKSSIYDRCGSICPRTGS